MYTLYLEKFNGKSLEVAQTEIEIKVLQYKTAQIFQLEHGGAGPVAEYEIMAIVNDHDGEFEIIPLPVATPEEVEVEDAD